MEGATCSLPPPRHRQVERTLAEFAQTNHNFHAKFTVKFLRWENGGSGITLRQGVLIPSFTIFRKDQETLDLIDVPSMCLLMPKTEGMLRYVNVFLFSPELETCSTVNILKHWRCRLTDLIVGLPMTMPDPGGRIWMDNRFG